MKKLKLGLIGCGRIGALLEDDPLRGKPCTHAGGFAALPSVAIAAACDIDTERLKRFGKRFNVPNLYTDHKEMLRQEDLDIVCVAAWTHLHAALTLDAARSGVRGIYCEKPIANNLKDARKMVRVCEKNNVVLSVNHERRFDPWYNKARALIQSGRIGEVRTIVGNALSWKPGKRPRDVHGGGPLFHDGTHLTDLLLYFGGPIDWVSGHAVWPHGKNHIEETACALLRFKSGAMGFIEGGGARNYFNFELDIQGSEGRLMIGNDGRQLHLAKKSKRFTGFTELKPVPFPAPRKDVSPFIGGARDLVASIRRGTPPASSGKDGLRALNVILSIYRSAQNKGQRIKLT